MTLATRSASLVWPPAVSVVIARSPTLRRPQVVVAPVATGGYSWPACCRSAGWSAGCDIPGGMPLYGHAVAEVLMVLVVAALPRAEMGEALDELDGLDPLDHLEAQLELVAQPQRSAVQLVERLAVHLVGEGDGVGDEPVDAQGVVAEAVVPQAYVFLAGREPILVGPEERRDRLFRVGRARIRKLQHPLGPADQEPAGSLHHPRIAQRER